MNFIDEYAKYMAFCAHTNPWCKQEHEITPRRMKYLMAIAIGMHEGNNAACKRYNPEAGWEYKDLKIVFYGSKDVNFVYLMKDATLCDMPEKYNPRTGISAENREWIRDTLHAFRKWDTDVIYAVLRDALPGKAFSNSVDARWSPCETTAENLRDAFSNLMYWHHVDETGNVHVELAMRNSRTVVEVRKKGGNTTENNTKENETGERC